jgi:hypothetical protein
MWKAFYENSALLELPLLSMFLFAFSFAAAIAFARRVKVDDPGQHLPLQNDAGAQ